MKRLRGGGGGGKVIGLAFGERSIAVAEVHVTAAGGASVGNDAGGTVLRTATFPLEPGALEKTEATGKALRTFLKDNRFSAGRAVVGLPARWLMARERQVPPAAPAALAAMLRLQAQRLFPPELKDLTYDYAGEVSGKGATVLLLAANGPQVERCANLAREAGLTVQAVTATSLALSAALGREPAATAATARVVLSLAADSAEVVVRADGRPRMLRHLAVTGAQLASENGTGASALSTVGSEMVRAATVAGGGTGAHYVVWDGVGLRPRTVEGLNERYGVAVDRSADLARLRVSTGGDPKAAATNGDHAPASSYGPAVALALAGGRPELLGVNFLKSKLTPPKKRKLNRRALLGILAGLAIVGGVAAMFWDLGQKEAQVDALTLELRRMKPQLDEARAMSAKLGFASGWYENRPSVLNALLHITQAFPQEGSIWATNVTINDAGKGTLAGKANDQREVLAVYERLRNDRQFTEVSPPDWRDAGGSSRDVAFTIAFTFNERAGLAPAATPPPPTQATVAAATRPAASAAASPSTRNTNGGPR